MSLTKTLTQKTIICYFKALKGRLKGPLMGNQQGTKKEHLKLVSERRKRRTLVVNQGVQAG